jgi:predicted acyl esterase
MGHVACTFAAGHRIGLHVSGANFPRFSRNLQVAEPSALAKAGRPAHVRLLHDPTHVARLVLWRIEPASPVSPAATPTPAPAEKK